MKTEHPNAEWFENWFNETYLALYAHRDEQQALKQVQSLCKTIDLPKNAVVLDAACGCGRHMKQFRDRGVSVVGFDLSETLIRQTKNESLACVRADMRHIPFRKDLFDYITCFFSSFGYLATQADDKLVLEEFKQLLKPGGGIFLDLLNKVYLLEHLVDQDEQQIHGKQVLQERSVTDNKVIKHITITDGTKTEHYMERLRLFTLEEMQAMCSSLGLVIAHIFGDEYGADYQGDTSPRMALVIKSC
ncbi:MAG: class I SAM-dependent methyltransferase [Fibrobacteria bacterium]|nr:class I SAM-dependent methyltransferase [Fibrobacteria bacterium]